MPLRNARATRIGQEPAVRGLGAVPHQLWGLVLVCLLAACGNLAGPDYERPATPQKAGWSDDNLMRSSARDSIRLDWWKNFGDPYLDQLINEALAGNIDLQVLAARTGVAEAAIGQANAARLPTVDAALAGRFQTGSGGGLDQTVSQAAAVGWEVDIWGKYKKGVQAQEADFKASQADWRAGYLALVSDVSATYFRIRQYDEQIDRQLEAVDRNQRISAIYDGMYQEGIIPETRILKQQAELAALHKDLIELRRLRALADNALATLLGIPAGELRVPPDRLSDTVAIVAVPGGLPADLLSRRPDLLAAEYRVLQAHQLEGQARLARLPSISLTAGNGSTSNALSNLLETWTLGLSPTINIPIFDPTVNAKIKVSEATTTVAEQEYRATVIRAFEEVENALVNLASRKQQRLQISAQRDKLLIISDQVAAQMAEGLVSQLEVLESERSVLAAELALLANQQMILTDTVALYKALGGGWPSETVVSMNQDWAQQ